MISCALNGRLGNNLFQIATAINLSAKLKTEFVLDTHTWAGHRGTLPVDLSMFGYKFKQEDVLLPNKFNQGADFHYIEPVVEDNTRISGFFQSWKYFEESKQDLLTEYFIPSEEVLSKLCRYTNLQNSLGISVRRGDYLMLQNNHCVLTSKYYQEVIDKYFTKDIDYVYIFSDDIEWCKDVFGKEVYYVEDSIGVQLFLMSKMDNLILSNSTFAWWGAYLNQKGGKIIAPRPWFGSAYNHYDTTDLYYPEWIIENHEIILQDFK